MGALMLNLTTERIALANLESCERELVAAEFNVVRAERTFAQTRSMDQFLKMVHAENNLKFWFHMVSRTERELAKAKQARVAA